MRLQQILLTLLLLLFSVEQTIGQEAIEFHDVSEGLSHSTVTSLVQDKQGYLWIGTEYGLNRYDGYTYKHIDLDNGENNVVNANFITCLYYNENSNDLWIGTYGGGLIKIALETFEFSNFNTTNNSLTDNYIRDIHLGEDSIMWVATQKGGICLVDLEKEEQIYSFGSFSVSQLKDQHITSITGQGDIILLGSWSSGVIILNTETGVVQKFFDESIPVRTMIRSSKDCFIIGTNNGVEVLSLNDHECHNTKELRETLSNTVILSLLEDRSGRLYVGTENEGLCILEKGKVVQHLSDSYLDNQISGNSIWSLYEDQTGIIWIGLHQKGLNKIDALEDRFKQIQKFKCGGTNVQIDQVSTLLETEDQIWIGTDGIGLFSWDKVDNAFQCHEFAEGRGKVITALLEDRNKTLWIGTWKDGVIKYNLSDDESSFIETSNTSSYDCAADFVHTIAEDDNGYIWVAYFGERIVVYDGNETIREYDQNNLISTRITCLEKGCNGEMIIGTELSGIQVISLDDEYNIKKSTSYLNSESTRISHNISEIKRDQSCGIWAATTKGLFYISENGETIQEYSVEQGLPSPFITSVELLSDTMVWGSTNKGLFSMNLKSKEARNYTTSDGLLSNQFLEGSSECSKEGIIYFGNISGVNFYDTQNLRLNKVVPEVYIKNLHVSNKSMDSLLRTGKTENFEFAHDENDLTFEYCALNFSQPEQNKFRIRLLGLETEWQNVSSKKEVEYKNLQPGEYVFEVLGSNNDELWSSNPQSFAFKILQPWYNSWWAWLIYCLVFFSIAYNIIRMTLARLKLESELKLEHLEIEKLKEIDKVKSRFVANISHELLTPLTMIISPLQGEQLAMEGNAGKRLDKVMLDVMLDNAERLKKYIYQILSLSKLESGSIKLNIREYDYVKFLRQMVESFESMANTRNIKLLFDTRVEKAQLYYDEGKMEQILSNLLSNAIKYSSSEGNIIVSLIDNADTFILEVKDNGVGISEENLPKVFDRYYRETEDGSIHGMGIGLSIVQQLVNLHSAKIQVESEPGGYTVFSIDFKKGCKHFEGSVLTDDAPTEEKTSVSVVPSVDYLSKPTEIGMDPDLPMVLLVEDNPDIATYIMSYLKNEYNFLWAQNGQSGIDIALAQLPDIIISDVMMPHKNGYQLCEELKTNEITSHIAIILLTVKSSTDCQIEGYYQGADHYMTKPFSPKVLRLMLSNIIKQKRDLASKLSLLTAEQDSGEKSQVEGLTDMDQEFLRRTESVIREHMGDSKFSVVDLSRHLEYSKSQLYRKLKSVISLSPNEFIRSVRLKVAAELIRQSSYNISEITYKVGFNDLKYFRSCFKKQYGVNPSEYKTDKTLQTNA